MYALLCQIFCKTYGMRLYGTKQREKYRNSLDFISMGKCVAVGVIDHLCSKSKIDYKVRCMNVDFEHDKNGKDDVDAGCVKNKHFYDVLRLIPTREYQIGRVREMID